jgi:carboxylate-amine ligase
MVTLAPTFTLGIEEEYLLVDRDTRDLAAAPDALMDECKTVLEDRVSPEFLQCQIEVGTSVWHRIPDARRELAELRRTISQIAAGYNLAPIAVATHPFADWQHQRHTNKERYEALARDLAGVGERMLICGMHVHVGIEDEDLRIDLLGQLSYFLPHLLALSASSPFWQGRDTGMASYRLSIFDNLPRTGLPPVFSSFGEYSRTVETLTKAGVIEDATKIWWDLRPSDRFPTLEARICDVTPRLDDTVAIAGLVQCLAHMLFRLRLSNQRWRQYERFLINENRWRAQRYGVGEKLMDFGKAELVQYKSLADELVELVADDAEILGCTREIGRIREIARNGNSADRQRGVYKDALEAGADSHEAMLAVVDSLIAETVSGLDE